MIEDGVLVVMGPGYETTIPIGGDLHDVAAIEFSEDGSIYGVVPATDTLVRIDPATGDSETVGSLGIDLAGGMIDLDEDPAGQLRMLADSPSGLYEIDRQTGLTLLVCEPDFPGIYGLASFNGRLWTSSDSVDPSEPGCGLEYIDRDGFFGTELELGPEGWIHSVFGTCTGWSCSITFSRINPLTGAIDPLGSYLDDIVPGQSGLGMLTFDPTERQLPPAIPALSRLGLLILVTSLAIAGAAILAQFSIRRF
jgi:hypothetical protein